MWEDGGSSAGGSWVRAWSDDLPLGGASSVNCWNDPTCELCNSFGIVRI